jgi:hypothetical protein
MRIVHDLRYGILASKHRHDVIEEVELNPVTSGIAQWSISGGYYETSRYDLQAISAQELRRLVDCVCSNLQLQIVHRLPEELAAWIEYENERLKSVLRHYTTIDAAIRDRKVPYTVRS